MADLDGIVDMEAETVYSEGMLAASWALDLARVSPPAHIGLPFLAIRYDDLDAERVHRRTLLRPAACTPRSVPTLRAFERDSQAGTSIARGQPRAAFGETNLARFT